jgi:hypothetical protein
MDYKIVLLVGFHLVFKECIGFDVCWFIAMEIYNLNQL